MTLAKNFSTYELLMADDSLQKHFAWVAKQKTKTGQLSKEAG
tara:strand:+ start:850 stop:975 length:126 start_codon:yes stop_codon:yes gene_type:complete